jgi:RHS repeat-associated protein
VGQVRLSKAVYQFFDLWQPHPVNDEAELKEIYEAILGDIDASAPWPFSPTRTARYTIRQGALETFSRVPIFEARPSLYTFMQDVFPTSVPPEVEFIGADGQAYKLQRVNVTRNRNAVKLSQIAKVKVGLQSGNNPKFYRAAPGEFRMPLPGGDTAVTGANFYHRDYLGSVPLVSSKGNRTSIAARLFAPYGESYNNVGITGDVNYTGDNQDLVAGTFDTPNRELNPTQGRWISPDPGHASWNAYQYSTNPLGETDQSGLDFDIAGGYGEGTASIGAEQLDGFTTDYSAIFNSVNTTSFNGQQPTVYNWVAVQGSPTLSQTFDSQLNPILDADGNPTYTLKDTVGGYWQPVASSSSSGDDGVLMARNNSVDDIEHLWGAWQTIKHWADKGECIVAADLCKDSTISTVKTDNVNKDPMKLEYDAEQCQAQAQASGSSERCSSAGWNNVQRSGWFQNEACKKAQECLLDLTTPQ